MKETIILILIAIVFIVGVVVVVSFLYHNVKKILIAGLLAGIIASAVVGIFLYNGKDITGGRAAKVINTSSEVAQKAMNGLATIEDTVMKATQHIGEEAKNVPAKAKDTVKKASDKAKKVVKAAK